MSSYQIRKTPGDTTWFRHDRFGMFIHWGFYTMLGHGEWIKNLQMIPDDVYDQSMEFFDPDLYDARDWARKAKAAGMKYAVLTTKHHDGFCMFDSAYTDYKCTNTPAGRDLVREYTDAFRAEGLKVGLYYSLLDWHHPDFPIDFYHPRKNDADAEKQNKSRDMRRYAQYMRDQVTELLTNYGKIDMIWFDFSYANTTDPAHPWIRGKGASDWEAEELIALCRRLQPGIMINNRTGVEQDLWTPEQYQPDCWLTHQETGELVTWEACQTFSGSWGYYRDETTWKSPEMLIRMLVNTVACGGNLLMNVGPTSRGYFDERAVNALKVYEDWMKYNSRSIYGCTMAEPEFHGKEPADVRFTQSEDGKRLYVHLFAYPYAHLQLRGFAGKVDYAQFLHDGSELLFTEGKVDHFSEGATVSEDLLVINLPPVKPNVVVPVIELFLK